MAKKGMIFFEEYFDYMDDMSPEQYYQFMGLIRDARYKGVDVDASSIEDKVVRLAWRAVRPSVIKSRKNSKDYENRNKGEEPQVSTYTPTEETNEPEVNESVSEKKDNVFQSEEDLIEAVSDIWNTDRDKATRMLNNGSIRYGYNFDRMLEAVRNG